jgi:hypothetical protein
LPVVKVGGVLFILREDWEEFLRRHRLASTS